MSTDSVHLRRLATKVSSASNVVAKATVPQYSPQLSNCLENSGEKHKLIPLQRGLKTPRAGMTNAARGNGKRRTRKSQSPRAAFFLSLRQGISACSDCFATE